MSKLTRSGRKTAAERGEGLWFRASALADRGRHAEAVRLFRRSGRLGYSAAFNRLGVAFHDGAGVRKSLSIALHYYRRALAVGDVCAANNIGVLRREQGRWADAARWFQRAVEQGDDDSLLQLAKLRIQQGGMTREVRAQLRRVVRSNNCTLDSQEEAEALLRTPAAHRKRQR